MRHVVMISKTFVATTAQRQLEELARQPGLRLTLITPPLWQADDGGVQTFTPTFIAGYRVITTPIRANGRYHVYHYPRLGGLLDVLQPDVVHMDDEPYNTATCHALWLCQQRKIPALAVAWQNILRRYPPPFTFMEKWVYRHVAAIIAGNSDAAMVVRAKGYQGPLPIFSLHGIDPSIWQPRHVDPPEQNAPFTIGYIGRLVPEKGIETLLDALTHLPLRCRLQIIGRGPDAERLRARATHLGLGERVAWQPY
ncbi:MAG: glycosyltransferase, partial [Ktedonobacteraceae bacterium]|nr:glycosyltransferase [Ktedonobacteraceae bacterium]